MAAPHVAGVAALMKSLHTALTPDEFYNALQSGLLTNDIGDAGRDDLFGYGVINALKSVQQAQLLAGGSATGSILASPTRIDFGTIATSRTLTLSQTGSSPPQVASVTSNAAWLSIDSSAANTSGGDYVISVNRNGLNDAIYTDNILFTLSNSNVLTIPVSLQVQNNTASQGDAGFIYVLLLEASTQNVIDQDAVDVSDGTYEFSFSNVDPGEYMIIAGSDLDNDFIICGPGESCGRYPTIDQPLRINVTDDTEQLNFLVSVTSQTSTGASTGFKSHEGYQRQPLIETMEDGEEKEATLKTAQ